MTDSDASMLRRRIESLCERVLAGEVAAAARVCRMVDDGLDGSVDLLKLLYPHTGRGWIVGVTGNPGAGKSTLVDRMIEVFRAEGKKVAVVAIDPTSPFSGGAILGDRIRMQRHFQDAGVFIRSLATRGALGGLSRTARDVVRVFDAWGAEVILVETVGVGQDELEVTRAAHTTLVVMAPGMGDDIQAIKAGILECADVFCVNKADREGADATARDLELMIALGGDVMVSGAHSRGHASGGLDVAQAGAIHAGGKWVVPIQKVVATKNQGIGELVERMKSHRVWLETTVEGAQRREQRAFVELVQTLRDALVTEAIRHLEDRIREAARAVGRREKDPYTACEELVRDLRAG